MNFASLSHEQLLQRVKNSPMEEELQYEAMNEICRRTNLGRDEAAVAALFQLGVLPLIVAALKNHEGHEGVASWASWALRCVVRESPERRAAAVAAGAVAPLLQALRRWRRLVFAEALGVLCLTEPAAREEALSSGALQLLRQLWEEKPGGRDLLAFCAFAMAQGEGNEFMELAGQPQWVKELERYQGNISPDDFPTLKTDVQKLVDLCREVQKTGKYPVNATGGFPAKTPAVAAGKAAGPSAPAVAKVNATGGYPAKTPAVAAGKAAPSVPAAAPTAMAEVAGKAAVAEAMLGSGRFLTTEDEEISILPKTRWEETDLRRSFLEELRENPGIRAVCPKIDDLAEDVQEKYELELVHIPSLKDTLQDMGTNGAHAVLAYTYDFQEGKQEGNLYFEMNKALRRRENRAATKECWGVVVRYALQGLAALQPFKGLVYRGMPHKEFIKEHYQKGRTIEWGAFTSASTSARSATQFMKDDGVLLKIEIHSGRDVSKTSFFPVENEVLLSPKCRFIVTSEMKHDKDLGVEVLEMLEQMGDVFKS